MKKNTIRIALIILLAVGILLSILLVYSLVQDKQPKPQQYIYETFTLEDYAWGISTFPKNDNVGAIASREDAAQKGIDLWVKYLTIRKLTVKYNPINGEPIVVAYDAESDCWLIKGTLPYAVIGAVPAAIIESSGQVVAVWMN